MQKGGNLRFFRFLPDAKTGFNWFSILQLRWSWENFFLGGLEMS